MWMFNLKHLKEANVEDLIKYYIRRFCIYQLLIHFLILTFAQEKALLVNL